MRRNVSKQDGYQQAPNTIEDAPCSGEMEALDGALTRVRDCTQPFSCTGRRKAADGAVWLLKDTARRMVLLIGRDAASCDGGGRRGKAGGGSGRVSTIEAGVSGTGGRGRVREEGTREEALVNCEGETGRRRTGRGSGKVREGNADDLRSGVP